jgi:hypothetical protein
MDDYLKGIRKSLDQLEVIHFKSIPIRVLTFLILNLTPILISCIHENLPSLEKLESKLLSKKMQIKIDS